MPRYNEFRRLLNLKPASSFETLTDVPQWADEMRRVYDDDIEKVDLTVGMFAEPLPRGFGFSDTAFRIFIVMASRRLNSDRFFTRDYTPGAYTPIGMQWINETTMSSVLLRHCPELRPALLGVENAFTPVQPRDGMSSRHRAAAACRARGRGHRGPLSGSLLPRRVRPHRSGRPSSSSPRR